MCVFFRAQKISLHMNRLYNSLSFESWVYLSGQTSARVSLLRVEIENETSRKFLRVENEKESSGLKIES